MKLIHRSQCKRVSVLARMWYRVCFKAPESSRRMCLLASLYSRLMDMQPKDVDKRTLECLNVELGLSRDPNALCFPALLGRFIWKQVLPIDRQDCGNLEHYVVRLMRKAPTWLWYGDMDIRQEDIRRVVQMARTAS